MAEKLTIATTEKEAVALKSEGYVFLAGGTEINRLGSSISANSLVSIKKIDSLKVIGADEDTVTIGAGCTFTQVVESKEVPEYFKIACKYMASRTKRNMATIGGCVACLRSDSYIMPTLLGAKAKLILQSNEKEMSVCACEYLKEYDAYKDMLITKIILPKTKRSVVSKRYANTAQSHGVLTMSIGCENQKDITIGLTLKNSGVFFLSDLAKTLEENPGIGEEELIDWAYNNKEIKVTDDMFGSEKYKRYLIGVTVSLLACELKKGGAR